MELFKEGILESDVDILSAHTQVDHWQQVSDLWLLPHELLICKVNRKNDYFGPCITIPWLIPGNDVYAVNK